MTDRAATATPFSRQLRERSRSGHSSSEGADLMTRLMSGEAPIDDYVALVQQHYAIYAALEGAAEELAHHPVVRPFLSPALTRLPALESDLQFLLGDEWRDRLEILPVTERYAARIAEVGRTWPAGYVAHHYTRYLGDLSGGLHIGAVIARRYGLNAAGTQFYRFDEIADPRAFKDAYRHALDAAPWGDAERDRVVDEVLRAYRENTELFVALAEHRTAA